MTRTIPRTSFSNSTLSLLPTALLVLAAAGLAGCDASADATPPPAPEVTVRAAVEQQIVDWDTYTGRFEAAQRVELRPRVAGYIDRVAFDEGSLVKRSEEHTSELQSLMRISYAVFCLKKKKTK